MKRRQIIVLGFLAILSGILIISGDMLHDRVQDANRLLWTNSDALSDELISNCVRQGADINERGYEGETLLMSAARRNDARTIQLLMKWGADSGMRDDRGQTAVDHARQSRSSEALRYLSNPSSEEIGVRAYKMHGS